LGCGPLLFGCQSSSLTAGKLYIKQEKYEQAREQLELAVKEIPTNAEAHYHLGRVRGIQGEYAAMADAFDKAQELSSKYDVQIEEERLHYWSRIYNSGVHAASGQDPDLRTARSHFATAVRVLPKHLKAWRNLAAIDYQLGEIDAAVEEFEHVVTEAPDDTSTYRMLGVIYLGLQRHDDAVRCFQEVLAVGEHRGALINLATTFVQQDRPEEARQVLQRAIEQDSECFECHYNLGNLLWSAEEFPAAREQFEKAVELNAADVDARFNLAVTYLALDELNAALPLLEQLSSERPDDGVVWRELGRIYALQSRIEESEAAYDKAISLGQ
jgi:tetratricopeptide (TPR) repeat protein